MIDNQENQFPVENEPEKPEIPENETAAEETQAALEPETAEETAAEELPKAEFPPEEETAPVEEIVLKQDNTAMQDGFSEPPQGPAEIPAQAEQIPAAEAAEPALPTVEEPVLPMNGEPEPDLSQKNAPEVPEQREIPPQPEIPRPSENSLLPTGTDISPGIPKGMGAIPCRIPSRLTGTRQFRRDMRSNRGRLCSKTGSLRSMLLCSRSRPTAIREDTDSLRLTRRKIPHNNPISPSITGITVTSRPWNSVRKRRCPRD